MSVITRDAIEQSADSSRHTHDTFRWDDNVSIIIALVY